MKKAKYIVLAGALTGAGVTLAEGLTAQSYVQEGLVTQLDAIDNEGTGSHNPAAKQWKDLKGSAYVNVPATGGWSDGRYFQKSTAVPTLWKMPAYSRNNLTVETAINIYSNNLAVGGGSYPRIFSNGESLSFFFDKDGTTAYLYIDKQDPDIRPSAGFFRTGSLAAFSGAQNYGIAANGIVKQKTADPVKVLIEKPAADWQLGPSGILDGAYAALRFYNRCLSEEELLHNATIDWLRYFSYVATGSDPETVVPWAEVTWSKPDHEKNAAPQISSATNFVRLVKMSVSIATSGFLRGLSLEDGASLTVPEGVTLLVNTLYAEGVPQKRGIYAATAANGRVVPWLKGGGIVRVGGSMIASTYPTTFLVPDAQGRVTFGKTTGASMTYNSIVGERPNWSDISVPDGTTLKLVGGVLLDEVPAGMFAAYDTTELKYVMCTGPKVFLDGSALVVPSGCIMRHLQPASNWKLHSNNVAYTNASGTFASTLSSDVVVNGTLWNQGDNGGDKKMSFSGNLSGKGNIRFDCYGIGMAFNAPSLDFNGTYTGTNPGAILAFRANRSTARIASMWMSPGDKNHYFHKCYCNHLLSFGPLGTTPTEGEFRIGSVGGNAHVEVNPADGSRWRIGGALLVWGDNTLHLERLTQGAHFVGNANELNMSDLHAGTLRQITYGTSNLIIDNCDTSGNYMSLYLSTNLNVTIGKVVNASIFDWTLQSGVVNRRTFDITNTCNASAQVLATDMAMLPARLSGFKGSVSLTDTTEGRSYDLPIDFSVGPKSLYNEVGCNGSGTLVQAPQTGTLNVTFDTTQEPPIGKYALVRFTSGGERLAGWTVNLNGSPVPDVMVGNVNVVVKKDSTGIWLNVCKPGLAVIVK